MADGRDLRPMTMIIVGARPEEECTRRRLAEDLLHLILPQSAVKEGRRIRITSVIVAAGVIIGKYFCHFISES